MVSVLVLWENIGSSDSCLRLVRYVFLGLSVFSRSSNRDEVITEGLKCSHID